MADDTSTRPETEGTHQHTDADNDYRALLDRVQEVAGVDLACDLDDAVGNRLVEAQEGGLSDESVAELVAERLECAGRLRREVDELKSALRALAAGALAAAGTEGEA